jgi:uncharacterized C2H2 Zn-finger protein
MKKHLTNGELKQVAEDDKNWLIKCPGCSCQFFSKHDLRKHLNAFPATNHEKELQNIHRQAEHENLEGDLIWIQSKYGAGKLLLASKDPRLAQAIRRQGKIEMGAVTYHLSQDEKWIIKERTGAF